MKRLMEGNVKASPLFVIALSIVSIIGFFGIIIESFSGNEIGGYVEALLILIIGFALIFEARINRLKNLRGGINSGNITNLVTAIVGGIAILTGIFSFPQIKIVNPTFLAIKGILSVIAIIVIVIQTWVVEKEGVNPLEKKKVNPLPPSR